MICPKFFIGDSKAISSIMMTMNLFAIFHYAVTHTTIGNLGPDGKTVYTAVNTITHYIGFGKMIIFVFYQYEHLTMLLMKTVITMIPKNTN